MVTQTLYIKSLRNSTVWAGAALSYLLPLSPHHTPHHWLQIETMKF